MLALLFLVLGIIGPGLERTGPARPFTPEPYVQAGIARFSNGTRLDLISSNVGPEAALEPGTYWLVALSAPASAGSRRELAGRGLRPVCPIPPQALVCRAERETVAGGLLSLPFVLALAPYPARARIAPELLDEPGPAELVLSLWPGEDVGRLAAALSELGMTDIRIGPRLVRFRTPADRIDQVARLEPVAWVQRPDPVEAWNSQAQWVMQVGWRPESPDPGGRRVWEKGIRGQDMVHGLFDSGINTDHDQFCDPQLPVVGPGLYPDHRKIIAYKLYPGAAFGDAGQVSYHGSGVAGTLAGNDSVCGNGSRADGIAPDALVCFVDVGATNGTYVFDDDLTALLDSVRFDNGLPEPVRQASGSFGSNAALGYYRLLEATLDDRAWFDKHFLVTWAAGNVGGGQYKVGHPACAKNVITVGACGNGVESNTMAGFSSRGPTRDRRIKPLVVAPGREVTTVDGPGNSAYASRNGTSYSAPAVSAALLLLRQYFRDGWYPFGSPDPARAREQLSSALLRGFAVIGADADIPADSFPNNDYGWGRFNLSSVLHFDDDSLGMTFMDETLGVSAGGYHEYRLLVSRREPLRVVLCWTDTAAAPAAEIALVNDLNLELISPDGNGYRGNQFLNGQSRANPADWDERNVEEVFLLGRPLTGWWTIRVRARSVFTGRQPYALAIKGGIAGLPGTAEQNVPDFPVQQAGTSIVSPASPLRLRAAPHARFTIVSPDGRRVASVLVGIDGCVTWPDGRRDASAPSPGVYFYRVEAPGGNPASGKLLLAR